jgi:hypothetical protein
MRTPWLRLHLTLLLAIGALAQPAPVFRGSWTASLGPKQVYRGKWSAQALPGTQNAAHGSWTLLNDNAQTIAEGTWLAKKSARSWQGTWTARVAKSQRSFSGTWEADLPDLKGKGFEEMFKQTLQKQIGGVWRSGRLQGNWWLKGSPY